MPLQAFFAELFGTAMLLLLGGGVVANVSLAKSKGLGGGTLMVNFGWGLAVFAGVYIAGASGGHLNPAVTLGLLMNPDATEFAPGIDKSAGAFFMYLLAQFIGSLIGAFVMWLAYRQQFDVEENPATKLGVFATGPEIRSPFWNMLTEAIATFVLVFVVISFGHTPSGLGPLAVAMLIVGIGASLGGPTGYAINPVRDLGPRIMHAILPIRGKGGSDWGYAWVPVVGPLVGGALAGLAGGALF